jgi:hypothetical protein
MGVLSSIILWWRFFISSPKRDRESYDEMMRRWDDHVDLGIHIPWQDRRRCLSFCASQCEPR